MAKKYGEFPIILETYRECLRDVLDVPGLTELLTKLHRREITLVEVETPTASPFASILLFDYVATYMYEGDTPNAERRAAALSLDRDLLRELLGQEELRDLIDPGALAQRRGRPPVPAPSTAAATSRDALHDVLRARRRPDARGGARRGSSPASTPIACSRSSLRERRAIKVRRRRRGTLDRRRRCRALPRRARRRAPGRAAGGVPRGRARRARAGSRAATPQTHGPFTTAELRARYGVDPSAVLSELERAGELVRGELRPGGSEREWCHPEVLRRLRRASLAVLRKEIEPADQRALARFLPAWQGVDRHPAAGAGIDRLRETLVAAAGARAPGRDVGARRAAAPRRRVLAGVDGPAVRERRARVDRRRRARAQLRAGRALLPRGPRVLASPGPPPFKGAPPDVRRARRASASGSRAGACFFTDLLVDVELAPEELQEALWDLVWAGEATNDAFAPLRAPRLTLARAQRERARTAARRSGGSRRRRRRGRAPPRRSRAAGR